MGHAFRPDGVPLEEHYVTAFPGDCMGILLTSLYPKQVLQPESFPTNISFLKS